MNGSYRMKHSTAAARLLFPTLAGTSLMFLAACRAEPQVSPTEIGDSAVSWAGQAQDGGAMTQDFEIVNVIPRDGIPAIDDPQFVDAVRADELYAGDDLVIGVSVGDDNRAYSVPFLSGHEIVNDTVGGRPISVTW